MSNELPPEHKPSFGAKGDSDAGVQLLWSVGSLGGGAVALCGAAMMVGNSDTTYDNTAWTIGAIVTAFGGLLLGVIAYFRERYRKD